MESIEFVLDLFQLIDFRHQFVYAGNDAVLFGEGRKRNQKIFCLICTESCFVANCFFVNSGLNQWAANNEMNITPALFVYATNNKDMLIYIANIKIIWDNSTSAY